MDKQDDYSFSIHSEGKKYTFQGNRSFLLKVIDRYTPPFHLVSLLCPPMWPLGCNHLKLVPLLGDLPGLCAVGYNSTCKVCTKTVSVSIHYVQCSLC